MEFKNYMDTHFPNLTMRPALFYSWEPGIRFELGVDYDPPYSMEGSPYIKGVYNRVIALFKELHKHEDDLFIVVNVNNFGDGVTFLRKLNIFSKYIKDRSVLRRLKQTTIPYVFPEDNEEGTYETHQFVMKCKASDIRYIPLLKAICNQDMGIKPKIFHDVFFINIKNKTVFHVYDDRGCDVIAKSPEPLKDIYRKNNGWILYYDREDIDKVFK